MSRLEKLHDCICRSIFTIEPPLSPDRLPHAFQLLVKLIEHEEDTDWSIGGDSYVSLDSLIVGAYWWFTDWHGGQSSDEYATLCALGRIFSPGMSSLEEGSSEYDVYKALESLFVVN